MRYSALPSVSLMLLLPADHPARSEEEPRAIIARAAQAVGGEANLLRARAVQAKIKGSFHDAGVKGSILEGAKFTGEVITQLPGQEKVSLFLETSGGRLGFIRVLNGDKAWTRDREVSQPDNPADVADLQQSAYVDYVSRLVPLLKDKAYSLSFVGETQIKSRPAFAIKVASKGHPDVTLYFDKGSGYLLKTQHRRRSPATNKEVVYEEFFSAYQEVNPPKQQEERLLAANVGTDDAALLKFLRKQTLSEQTRQKIRGLIRGLGNPSFQVRQQAKEDLITQGVAAVPLLKQALHDPDPEISGLAKECLQAIGKAPDPAVILAAIRLLALRKPAGATEALLAYLPSAADEAVAQEVQAALATVAFRDGKPDQALVEALKDNDPQRRAAAAALLGSSKDKARALSGQRLFLPGLKWPTKGEQYEDGKRTLDYELTDIQFFNKLDDSIFSQP